MEKWIKCSERLPEELGSYLVWVKPNEKLIGYPMVVNWCEGWNCHRKWRTGGIYRRNEMRDVVAWRTIELYE